VRRRATVAGTADSTSLEKFLLILSSTLLYLGSPSLASLYQTLKETIRNLKGQEKQISEDVICRAIENLFMLVHD
ncbi:Protein CBG22247, partial [Caenorhabditis briggsae]